MSKNETDRRTAFIKFIILMIQMTVTLKATVICVKQGLDDPFCGVTIAIRIDRLGHLLIGVAILDQGGELRGHV